MSTKTEKIAPQSYEFKIEDIKAFKSAKNGQEFKSPFFELHGFKWCLRLFPNGSTKTKRGNINYFLWLTSLPPRYSKIAVNITLTLKESDINTSFPHQFTDKAITRGWMTGTVKTADIEKLNSLTFGVMISIHAIYGASGTLISINGDFCDGDDEKKGNLAILNKQSSELILDKQNITESRLETLSLKFEEIILKFDNMQNAIELLSEKQDETDNNINSIVNEIKNIKKYLGDDYKGQDMIELNEENKKLKYWLENECKMGEYFNLFIQNGVDNMAICKLLSMDHLETMGINKIGHRVQISHQIAILKQELDEK